MSSIEALPLSLLNDFLYCPRRAALKMVEGWRAANEHTARGDIVHEHADLPGYEVAKGVMVWRALPVWSERLGLSGKCDIVEVELESNARPHPGPLPTLPQTPHPAFGHLLPIGCGEGNQDGEGERFRALRPVEYKKGKRRQFDNDDAQLCAQALCLEEMFNVSIPRGAVFHTDSKRRRDVQLTENAIAELHALLNPQPSSFNPQLPAAIYKPACEECSLYEICLPKATAADSKAARLARQVFQI